MVHKKIRIPRESATEIMRALGNLKVSVEFEDLTKDDIEAKKNFGEMIKRCFRYPPCRRWRWGIQSRW